MTATFLSPERLLNIYAASRKNISRDDGEGKSKKAKGKREERRMAAWLSSSH
jgi:hypothetical protein